MGGGPDAAEDAAAAAAVAVRRSSFESEVKLDFVELFESELPLEDDLEVESDDMEADLDLEGPGADRNPLLF